MASLKTLLELGMPVCVRLLLYLQRGPGILSWSEVEVPQFSPTRSWSFGRVFFRLHRA